MLLDVCLGADCLRAYTKMFSLLTGMYTDIFIVARLYNS